MQTIAQVLIEAVEEAGPDSVIQVITDSAPACVSAGHKVEQR
jgi:hypothetical protein